MVNTPQLRQAYNDNLPRVTRFGSALGQNLALFAQYRALAASPEFAGSDPVRRKVVDNALRDFRLGRAELDEAAKARFSAVLEELAAISAISWPATWRACPACRPMWSPPRARRHRMRASRAGS